ncbi:unnamed protein product [Sympodiomycopsis kandeliae]
MKRTRDIKVTLAGDTGVGKSSLVTALVKDSWSERVQKVVPEITLPLDVTETGVSTRIVDTSCTPDKRNHLESSLRSSNVIILVYSISSPTSFDRIPTYWLPYLRSLGIINVPIILVGNKIDQRIEGDVTNEALEDEIAPVMAEFKEVESCIETSVKEGVNVSEVFHFAQKAVLYPTAPLYDARTHSLKEPCIAALKRIFLLCDSDKDYLLNDDELNDFQRRCFGVPLRHEELQGIKDLVASTPLPMYAQYQPQQPPHKRRDNNTSGGRLSTNAPRSSSSSNDSTAKVNNNSNGATAHARKRKGSSASSSLHTLPPNHPHLQDDMLTLSGWLHLHTLFVQKGRLETTWHVLASYGYGQDLALSPDYLNPPSFTVPSDCAVELSPYGYSFLTDIFEAHDKDRDGALSESELSELFATAPNGKHPWVDSEFPHTTVTDENGAVTLQGWLAQWSMTTLLDYKVTLANLAYLGYPNFILGGASGSNGHNADGESGGSGNGHGSSSSSRSRHHGHQHHHEHASSISSLNGVNAPSSSSTSSPNGGTPGPPPTTSALTLTRRNTRRDYSSFTFSSSSSSSSPSHGHGNASAKKKKKKKGDPAERSVFLGYVVGPAGSGKSSILNAMVGKRFESDHRPTQRPRSVVSAIEQDGMEKYLVLQEFGSRNESESLRSQAKLSLADVIIYVYDSSDTNSFSYVANLRQQFSSYATSRSHTLLNLPSLFIGNKVDEEIAQQRHQVQPDIYCKKLEIEKFSPFLISVYENNLQDLYNIIVQIASNPIVMEAIPGGKERYLKSRRGFWNSLFGTSSTATSADTDTIQGGKQKWNTGRVLVWLGFSAFIGGTGVWVWNRYASPQKRITASPTAVWNWVTSSGKQHVEL